MTQKITFSDLNLHQMMRGVTTQLSRYIKDEIYVLSKRIQQKKKPYGRMSRNARRGYSANSYYEAISKMIRQRADRDVIKGGYKEALKDDRNKDSKINSLYKTFLHTHKKELESQLRSTVNCFKRNGSIVMKGKGSEAFLSWLLIEYGYDIVSDEQHNYTGCSDIKSHPVYKPLPHWKLKVKYSKEYNNSCNVDSCPCDSKASDECIEFLQYKA